VKTRGCGLSTRFSNTAGLVVEDAPSGLFAGHRADARTLAVCTSHTHDKIVASGVTPDFIVDDLTKYENQAVLSCPVATLIEHLLGYLQDGSMAKLLSRSMTLSDERSPL
jgi:hypothetical protein